MPKLAALESLKTGKCQKKLHSIMPWDADTVVITIDAHSREIMETVHFATLLWYAINALP